MHNPPGGSRADILRKWSPERRSRWIESLTDEEALALKHDWSFWARAKQLPPSQRYLLWILLMGRGAGKTRAGAQWVIEKAENSPPGTRITLAGRTIEDAVSIMVKGESGVLEHSPPWFRPRFVEKDAEIRWPNGVIGLVFGATRPDAFRGFQSHFAWADEICSWNYWECIDQLLLGLRLGEAPQGIVTTTPRPLPRLRELIAKPTTITTTGTTYENLQNMAPTFASEILAQFEGTRLGLQELHARILDDSPSALFKRGQIDADRRTQAPPLLRVVVGVDPAGTNSAKANHTGIVVAGLGEDRKFYILADGTISAQPTEWAGQIAALYHRHSADRVVAETNMGGDMVETLIKVVDPSIAYRGVHASRGKITRAEPIAALYEQHKVHHVGFFPQLEDEMCSFDPMSKDNGLKGPSKSPDRCFVAGTQVVTEYGARSIENIEPGDKVLTRAGYQRVISAGMTDAQCRVYTLDAAHKQLTGSTGHPVYAVGTGFVPLGMLLPGDRILCLSDRKTFNRCTMWRWGARLFGRPCHSTATVTAVCDAGVAAVYNIKVENAAEYYANGILVHNCDALVWALTDLHENNRRPIKNLNFNLSPRRTNPYQGF